MEKVEERVGQQEVSTEETKKLSYEELENVAHQLSDQTKQLYAKLQETNVNNMFKRLDYLFKVVENSPTFNKSFVQKCITEIEGLITIPEENIVPPAKA